MALNGNLKFVEDHLIQTVLELGKSDVSNVIINCEKTIKALSHVPEIKAESHFILSLVNKYKNQ